MKTFIVTFDFGSSAQVTVEAENEEEARELAESEGREIAADWLSVRKVRVEEKV